MPILDITYIIIFYRINSTPLLRVETSHQSVRAYSKPGCLINCSSTWFVTTYTPNYDYINLCNLLIKFEEQSTKKLFKAINPIMHVTTQNHK